MKLVRYNFYIENRVWILVHWTNHTLVHFNVSLLRKMVHWVVIWKQEYVHLLNYMETKACPLSLSVVQRSLVLDLLASSPQFPKVVDVVPYFITAPSSNENGSGLPFAASLCHPTFNMHTFCPRHWLGLFGQLSKFSV